MQYEYNGDGVRARRGQTVDGVTTRYVQDVAAPLPVVLAALNKSQPTYYLYGLDLIAQQQTAWQYYHTDGLGSVRNVTDERGREVGRYSYTAFGADRAVSGVHSEWRFTGEQWDAAAGLYFLRARYYDPGVGRFVSADAFPGYLRRPQTQNRYVYVTNNPVNLIDPAGLDEHDYYVFIQGAWDQTPGTWGGGEVTADPSGIKHWLEDLRRSFPREYQGLANDARWETWKREHVLLVAYEGIPATTAASDLFERVKNRQTGIRGATEPSQMLRDKGFHDKQGQIRLIGHSFGGAVAIEFALSYANCINTADSSSLQIKSVATIDSPLRGIPGGGFERYRYEPLPLPPDDPGPPIYKQIDRIEEFARGHPEISMMTVSNAADLGGGKMDWIGHEPIPGVRYMPGYMQEGLQTRRGWGWVPMRTDAGRYYNNYNGQLWPSKIHDLVMSEDELVSWWVNLYGGLY